AAFGKTDRINTIRSAPAAFPDAGGSGHHLGNPKRSPGCHAALREAWRVRPLHGLAAANRSRTPSVKALLRKFGEPADMSDAPRCKGFKINPSFDRWPAEAMLVGRILAAFGELELSLCSLAGNAIQKW